MISGCKDCSSLPFLDLIIIYIHYFRTRYQWKITNVWYEDCSSKSSYQIGTSLIDIDLLEQGEECSLLCVPRGDYLFPADKNIFDFVHSCTFSGLKKYFPPV